MTRALQARLADDRGDASIMLVVVMVALIAMLGLVVDVGGRLRAADEAAYVARQAARAAGQQIETSQAQDGTWPDVTNSGAQAAASSVIGAAGMNGSTSVSGQTVTVTVTEVTSGGIEVKFGEDDAPMTAFVRKSDLSRDRADQRPERFAVGDRVDAQITNVDKAARRVSLSIKSLEMAEEKEAIEQFGSSDSGASLGDILGAALRERATPKE